MLDARFWEAAHPILMSRSAAPDPNRPLSALDPETFGIFNDLMLLETYHLISETRRLIDQVRDCPDRMIVAEKKMAHYDYSLCVLPHFGIADLPEKLKPVINGWVRRHEIGELRSGPRLLIDAQNLVSMTCLAPGRA